MTKKQAYFSFAAFALVISLAFGYQLWARQNNNDPVVQDAAVVDNVAAHLTVISETTATSTLLVDLDDTTNFPHFVTAGSLELSQIRFDFHALGSATTTVKIGVVASTTPEGNLTDLYWFDEATFTATDGGNTDDNTSLTLNYAPSTLKLNLSSGEPASFLTNDYQQSTTDYATTTALLSPKGYSAPEAGDLIMKIYRQSGAATTSATVLYRVVE